MARTLPPCIAYPTDAAPYIAGLVALIRAKHPELTPFLIKTVLLACASNMTAG